MQVAGAKGTDDGNDDDTRRKKPRPTVGGKRPKTDLDYEIDDDNENDDDKDDEQEQDGMTIMCKTPSILSYFGLKEQTYKTTSGQRKSCLEARNKQIEEMKGEEV